MVEKDQGRHYSTSVLISLEADILQTAEIDLSTCREAKSALYDRWLEEILHKLETLTIKKGRL